jgi:hypothetical protein
MNAPPPEDERDPLSAYADGDPGAVRAAAPREPSEAEWDAVRRRIRARLAPEPARPHARRAGPWAAGALVAATAAALAWVAFRLAAPDAPAPERVQSPPPPAPEVAVAPAPHEADPLAEFAVLPVASADDVVLHRVPGDGWLPVGADPLPGSLSLASADDVELDEPNPAWPSTTVEPRGVPMIFAAKPR